MCSKYYNINIYSKFYVIFKFLLENSFFVLFVVDFEQTVYNYR